MGYLETIYQPIVFQPQQCLEAAAGNALEAELAAIAQEQSRAIVIDMSAVDMVDSAGLFSLVSGLRTARSRGCRLVLCHLKPPVRLIFEISQLDRLFEIFETKEAAIAALASESASTSASGWAAA